MKAPWVGAIAGIVFSILLIISLALIRVSYQFGNVYATRMAGVFMMSMCTLAIRTVAGNREQTDNLI
jgi:hypothetical protein